MTKKVQLVRMLILKLRLSSLPLSSLRCAGIDIRIRAMVANVAFQAPVLNGLMKRLRSVAAGTEEMVRTSES